MKRIIRFVFCIAASVAVLNFASAQIVDQTDFEQFTSGSNFTQASWATAGFTVPWVNGFDVNRGMIDNTYFKSGSKSLRLFYPKGQFGPSGTGGQAPLTVPPQNEYYSSYYVRFSDNFSFGTTSLGGKLPGLSGGNRCSGCAVCTGTNGFTARIMWRTGGKAVIYLYHLNKVNPPCGDNYDIVVGGQTLMFQKGVWYKISQRLKVNSGTNKDGEVEMWINDQHAQIKLYNGTLVDKLTGLQFVTNTDKVDGLYFSTFHGGNDATWAPTVDSYTWFDDIVISTRLSDVVNTTVTSIQNELKTDETIFCFPNPFQNSMTVNRTGYFECRIYDLAGLLVEHKVANDMVEIGQSLDKGAYIMKVISKGESQSTKIIKH